MQERHKDADVLLDKVVVDEGRHDCQRDRTRRLAKQLQQILVGQPNNVLAVNLHDLVVDEEAIAVGNR